MNDHDLDLFLLNLTPGNIRDVPRVAGMTGGLVYGAIEVLDKLLTAFGVTLGGRTKLAMSLVGAVAVPAGALALVKRRGLLAVTPNAWFLLACAVSWAASQVIHGALEKKEC